MKFVCTPVDGEERSRKRPAKNDEEEEPKAKRLREGMPEIMSFQHPVSECVQRYPNAVFTFKGAWRGQWRC